MGDPAGGSAIAPPVGMHLPDPRGTRDRGTADRGTGSRDTQADERERRKREYLDGMRAALTEHLTSETLATESIEVLLIRVGSADNAFRTAPGPRTEYATAVNLLALYLELAQRAGAAPRDGDGALLMRNYRDVPVPWTSERPKSIDEVRPFDPKSVALFNRIVAQGPPEESDLPSLRRGPAGKNTTSARAPKAGLQAHGVMQLPFGMRGVVHPGGPDARIIYSILKTPEMTTTTENGRIAILEAVIARVLAPKYSEQAAGPAARALVQAAGSTLKSSAEVVKATEPDAFEKRSPGMEFTFEVGLSFLLRLDEVTDGAVPMALIDQLDAHVDVERDRPKPLWEELYPRATRKERAYWLFKRAQDARAHWDPKRFPLHPGVFYPARGMTFVAYGDVAGDQIWCTHELKIYRVNERALLLEAFRKGVMDAAGGVALAYMLVSTSLLLIDGPAIVTMLGRLRFPMQLAKEFAMELQARPLMLVGRLALDQGANVILSGGWDNYVNSLSEPEGWFNMLFSVLGATHAKVDLPSGAHVEAVPEGARFDFVVTEGAAPREGGATGPMPHAETASAASPKGKAAASGDEGSQVVLRTEPATDPAPPPPVQDRAVAGPSDEPKVRRDKPAETSATADPGTEAKAVDDRLAAGEEHASVDDPGVGAVDDEEAAAAGGGRRRGQQGNDRARYRRPPKKKAGPRGAESGGTDGKGLGGRGTRGNARGVARRGGGRATGEYEFVRDGISYRVTTTPEGAARFEAIPAGDTVVYTIHDDAGDVIYVGITRKSELRDAITRLGEHLGTKRGEFLGQASEFRVVGHYDREAPAHALEQSIVSHQNPEYNIDKQPWDTWVHGRKSALVSKGRDRRVPEGLDKDLGIGLSQPPRRPVQDWEGEVPDPMGRPIRFDVDFDDAPP